MTRVATVNAPLAAHVDLLRVVVVERHGVGGLRGVDRVGEVHVRADEPAGAQHAGRLVDLRALLLQVLRAARDLLPERGAGEVVDLHRVLERQAAQRRDLRRDRRDAHVPFRREALARGRCR